MRLLLINPDVKLNKMKIFAFISFLVVVHITAFSQVDPALYYAASRLDYYTNEEVGEILVSVPETKKEHKITTDIVFEYEPLNKNYPVSSSGVSTVPFPMKLLREGQNEITVSFYEDEKWVDSRKVWIAIRPHHENPVKIDRATGGLSVDGMPLMPFGFYAYFPVEPTLPEDEAINGFNMISPYQKVDRKTLKYRKEYMNRCADLGIRVNYNLCSVAGGGGVESSRLEGLSSQEKREMLRKEVEMFRDHPALLTWYIADEPDSRNLPADSLKETYKLIKELDPYHPVSLVLNSPRKAAEFRDVMDIVMTDPYPIPQGRILEVKEYTDIIKKVFWLEKPVWTVIQAFGGNEWWQREPNPREVRAMTYLAVIHGATGIQYFIRSGPNSFPKSVAAWDECGALALEISELTPDILSPHYAPVIIASDDFIHAKVWNRAGLVTIAVVNEQNKPAAFTLKIDGIDITITADVMFENRQTDIKAGVIGDIIDGYGTRVYRFDARPKHDLPKDYEPGNLTIDPGFEDILNVGVPAACYVYNGADRGSTYFIDSRRHYQGEHSLRLNNPSEKPGNRLSFFGLNLSQNKSYTISIMAQTGPSSNKPGGKKGGPARFRLALGAAERVFACDETWQKFEIPGIRLAGQTDENARVSPQLEMAGKGTAWFDLLQVYPDMVLTETRGTAENLRNIELKCIHPDAKIFYTSDGSEPTTLSQPYLIPLEIDNNVRLKAAAFNGDLQVGFVER
jgi:hypothetical protein